jgi:hypothetical protein
MKYLSFKQLEDIALSAGITGEYSAEAYMKQKVASFGDAFDIFLSHSFNDKKIVAGVLKLLTDLGLKVYVDWVIDPQMDRNNISLATADKLRIRMRQSKSLIFLHSENSKNSKWMPWELGYFDGFRGNIAILPISNDENKSIEGQEYIGIYPYIDSVGASLFVNGRSTSNDKFKIQPITYLTLEQWIERPARY